MKKTYFMCATQPYNLGDLVINKMLVRELSKHSVVFVDCYNLPSNFTEELTKGENVVNMPKEHECSLKSFSAFSAIKFIKNQQIESFFLTPGPMGLRFSINNIIILLELIILYLLGVKIYRIGSDCDMKSDSKFLRRLYNRFTTRYYLRSNNIVDQFNSYYGNVSTYMPDLSLLLAENKRCNKLQKVAVSFRPIEDSTVDFKSICVKQIKYLLSKKLDVCLYFQVAMDEQFVRELYSELKEHDNVYYRDTIVWYSDISFYDDKLYVLSNRLHSLLLGTVYGCIPLAYIKDSIKLSKIRHVFNSIFENKASKYLTNINNDISIEDFNIDSEQDYIYKAMINGKDKIQKEINTLFMQQ